MNPYRRARSAVKQQRTKWNEQHRGLDFVHAVHHRLPTIGWKRVLEQAHFESRAYRAHRRGVSAASALGPGLRLHIGCGPLRKSGWVNIDLLDATADLALDLREPLPFADGQAVEVFSEHFFEHLEWPGDADRFLSECLRVLAPGGLFSVTVPDAEEALHKYVEQDEAFFAMNRERWHPAYCTTSMDSINYTFRQAREHQYAYDEQTLLRRLTEAGYVEASSRDFDPARDSESRRDGTLRVDARRPRAPAAQH